MSLKPRSDAKLKTLSPERQFAIADYARSHSLDETVAWLRADGFSTSRAALSGWLSWYQLQAQLKRNESTVETLLGRLKDQRPDWTPDQIEKAGQAFFGALALEQQDPKAWYLTQTVGIKRQQLDLEEKKFRRETCQLFLQWAADQRAREIAAGAGSNSEKIERLGQLMFGEAWTA